MKSSYPWVGACGARYFHLIYPLSSPQPFGPVNYVLARNFEHWWIPILIGQTTDLSRTMSSSEFQKLADLERATHIHVLPTKDEIVRSMINMDLLQEHERPLNLNLTATF